MALTYGFYNSMNGDRKYNAVQMASIFDGVINDGIYAGIGNKFTVSPGTGLQVLVGTGRAWFNHTWTYNDASYPLAIAAADKSLKRIDAVILEVNAANATRANRLLIKKGTPASSPAKPTATNSGDLHQHILAYVTVNANATSFTAANIEQAVGTSQTPFVTSVLQQTNIDTLYSQWKGQFDTWFSNVQAQLAGNVATNLQNQINTLNTTVNGLKTSKADLSRVTALETWKNTAQTTINQIDSLNKFYIKRLGYFSGNKTISIVDSAWQTGPGNGNSYPSNSNLTIDGTIYSSKFIPALITCLNTKIVNASGTITLSSACSIPTTQTIKMNPNIELRFMYNQKVDSPSVQYSTPIQNIKTYYGWYLGRMQYVGTGSSTSTLSFTLEHPEDKSAGSKVGNVYTLGSFLDSLTFSKGGNTSYSLSGTASDVQTSHDLRLSNCYWGSTTFKRNFSITYSATINVYGIALSDLGL